MSVIKTLSFHRGQYQIGLDYQIQNDTATPCSFYALRADPAQRPAHEELHDFQRREPRVPRPGDMDDGTKYRKLEPPTPKTATFRVMSPTAGSPPCSIISSPRSCRRRARSSTSRWISRATSTCSRARGPQSVAPGASGRFARRCSWDRSSRRSSNGRAHALPGDRLRQAVRSSRSRCSGCSTQVHALRRQLGLRDHPRHAAAQAAVLSAVRGQRPLDGEDEGAAAAHQGAAGDLQGRSREARPGDDGAVPAREGQSGRRLPADADPDPGVLRVLLGAARERRDAPGAVHSAGSTICRRAIRCSYCR